MDFKEAIYKNYISLHNQHLFGTPSISRFRAHFAVNDYYLGKFLPQNKTALIADIGCGDGNLVYWMQQKGYTNACGVDVSEEQINTGNSLGISNLEKADLNDFLIHNKGKFDLIIAKDVVEHFTRQEAFDILLLAHESLSENGKLIIQVPNGQGLNYAYIYYGDITHEKAYTESAIRQLTMAAGFTTVKVYPVTPFPNGIKGLLRAMLWKFKVAQLRFWKMVETGSSKGEFTANIIAEVGKN